MGTKTIRTDTGIYNPANGFQSSPWAPVGQGGFNPLMIPEFRKWAEAQAAANNQTPDQVLMNNSRTDSIYDDESLLKTAAKTYIPAMLAFAGGNALGGLLGGAAGEAGASAGADELFQQAADEALRSSGNYYLQSAAGQAAMDAANLAAFGNAGGGFSADQLFQQVADQALQGSGNYYMQDAAGQAAMDALNTSALQGLSQGLPEIPELSQPFDPSRANEILNRVLPEIPAPPSFPGIPSPNADELLQQVADEALSSSGNYYAQDAAGQAAMDALNTSALESLMPTMPSTPNADDLFQKAADEALKTSGNYYNKTPLDQWLTNVGNVADIKGGGVLDYASSALQNLGGVPNPLSSSGGTLGSLVSPIASAVGGGGNLAALVGAGLGAASGGGTNSATSQSKTDPRFDQYLYGTGYGDPNSILGAAQKLWQDNRSGLNPTMQQGLDMQRAALTDPAYAQSYQQMRNQGNSLMNQPIAGNPFTSGLLGGPTAQAGGVGGLLGGSRTDRIKSLMAGGRGLIG